MYNIVVFVSGNGSNLQAIIDAQTNGTLPINIIDVICNKNDAFAIERCKKAGVPWSVIIKSKGMSRRDYEREILKNMMKFYLKKEISMVVLAGWMFILSDVFIYEIETTFKSQFINLHPALPGQFPGGNGIEDAYNAFKSGLIDRTGVMVHRVIPQIDAGEVIEQIEIPIYFNDTLETLRARVQYFEKPVLLHAISKLVVMIEKNNVLSGKPRLIYTGKVRNMYDIGHRLILLESTDKQSAFDRHICTIPGKGEILTEVSGMWFDITKHIIPNHYMHRNGNTMICKKLKRFDVEVVVRGYIAGSTSTSLWTHYSKGVRNYCGIEFPDGLVKNQKLQYPVVTPTTKDEKDEPISEFDIVNRSLMTSDEWKYVKDKALQLYMCGVEYARKKGLILVDTKYEFGKDSNGNIFLIDEIHTCDSSRYWMESTYESKFSKGENPDSLDKDVVRNYILSKCDPYKEPIPDVPEELIDKASKAYRKFYEMITGKHFYEYDRTTNLVIKASNDYFSCIHKDRIVLVKTPESHIYMNSLISIRDQFEKCGIYTNVYTFDDTFNYSYLDQFPVIVTENLELKNLISCKTNSIVMTSQDTCNLVQSVRKILSYLTSIQED